jgi:hypothetical protein
MKSIGAERRARVFPLRDGRFCMMLPLATAEATRFLAFAEIPTLTDAGERAETERLRLERWGQRVCDHLRCTHPVLRGRAPEEEHGGQERHVWQALLTLDHVVRHLRVHKNPGQNQQRILEAVFGLVKVQTLVWVPQDKEAAVVIKGQADLHPGDYRRLAASLPRNAEGREGAPFLCNVVQDQSWGKRYPQIRNLLAFPVADRGLTGWVLAINKEPVEPTAEGDNNVAVFRRSDAALVTAFVSLLELQLRSSRRHQDLKNTLVELLSSLTAAHDAKDAHTYGHSERVARIAVEIGRELRMGPDELGDLYLAGLLHDIGKIGLKSTISEALEPSTRDAGDPAKDHVAIGYAILSNLPQFRNLLPGVLYHHEHFDGSGYPEGLAQHAIPRLARILAVAEAYDELTTSQGDYEAMSCRQAEEALAEEKGRYWDPEVIEAFMRCRGRIHAVRQRGVGESLKRAFDETLRRGDSSMVPVWRSPTATPCPN